MHPAAKPFAANRLPVSVVDIKTDCTLCEDKTCKSDKISRRKGVFCKAANRAFLLKIAKPGGKINQYHQVGSEFAAIHFLLYDRKNSLHGDLYDAVS